MAELQPTQEDLNRLDKYIEKLKLADELHKSIANSMNMQVAYQDKLNSIQPVFTGSNPYDGSLIILPGLTA